MAVQGSLQSSALPAELSKEAWEYAQDLTQYFSQVTVHHHTSIVTSPFKQPQLQHHSSFLNPFAHQSCKPQTEMLRKLLGHHFLHEKMDSSHDYTELTHVLLNLPWIPCADTVLSFAFCPST